MYFITSVAWIQPITPGVTPIIGNFCFGVVAPCRLEAEKDATGEGPGRSGTAIVEIDYSQPVFRPFAAPHHGDFSRVTFGRYFTVTGSQAARVLARFGDGRPAVLEKNVGKGASLMVVSGADLEMNDFASMTVFLPFVHEAAKHLSAFGATREPWVTAGSEIVAEVPADAAEAKLTVPDGETIDLEVEPSETGDGA